MTEVVAEPTDTWVFQPFSDAHIADPYPSYRRLLQLPSPYYQSELGFWVVARHADVLEVLTEKAHAFSSRDVSYRTGPADRPASMTLVVMDEPDHGRVRAEVIGELSASLEAAALSEVGEVLARLLEKHEDGQVFDFATEVARPLSVAISGLVLGLPAADRARVKRWADTIGNPGSALQPPSAETRAAGEIARSEVLSYLGKLVEQGILEGPATPLTGLLRVHSEGSIGDDQLIMGTITQMSSGEEPTTEALSNLVHAFIEHPDEWRKLRNDPGLIPRAVDEALRFDAAIQQHFRTANQDVAVGSGMVPSGGRLMVLFGAANRDPAHVDRPDVFSITRDPVEHLSFGAGGHGCWGQSLANLMCATVLEHLLDRASLLVAGGQATRGTHPMLRGFKSLPMLLQP